MPDSMEVKHFLDIDKLDGSTLRLLVDTAARLKQAGRTELPETLRPLPPQTLLALIFEKPSTRTRVSFEAAIRQLGGQALMLSSADMQLGRGETIADTAKVLSRYVDAVMIRTDAHEKLLELAENADIPVINGLTDYSHPCQIIADIQTFEEFKGPIKDRTLAWTGDGNNVANSWIHAAAKFGFTLNLACPPELPPDQKTVDRAREQGAAVHLSDDPVKAARGADCVMTDTWVSMGDRDAANRHNILQPYQVTGALMEVANKDAIFMHCLPAHRGEEVLSEVIDGPQSVVFDEAENRLHAQKAILSWCLNRLE